MVFFAFILSPFATAYEARAPELVVKAFVEAIQKEDLTYLEKYADMRAIANHAQHPYSMNQLKDLFLEVEVDQIRFTKPILDSNTRIIGINMIEPFTLTFQLQHQNAKEGKGDFYRIMGLSP